MKKKSKLFNVTLLILLTMWLSSCMTTKTNVANYKEVVGSEYRYDNGKQFWLFWGLVPIGRTDVATPDDGICQVVTKYRFGDVLISCLTAGIVTSYSIKVNAKRVPPAPPVVGSSDVKYDFKNGDLVVFSKDKYNNVEGEIIALYPDRAVVKFKRQPTLTEKAKGIVDEVEDRIDVPFENIAKR